MSNTIDFKNLIIEKKIDVILLNEFILDNTNSVFYEINNIGNKISIILISNNSFFNQDFSIFKNLEVLLIKKPFSFSKLKNLLENTNKSKKYFPNSKNINIRNLERTEKTNTIYEAIIKIVKNNLNVLITGESGTGKSYIASTINSLLSKNQALELTYVDYNNEHFYNLLIGNIASKDFLKYKGIELERSFRCIILKDIDTIALKIQLLIHNELKKNKNSILSLFKEKKIIATTTKNIKYSLRNNNFSNELFYQLDMYNIFTIPLRDRSEDIQGLVNNFIYEYNENNKEKKELTIDSLIEISKYLWPGNIKQIKNFINRVLKISETNSIDNQLVLSELSNEFTYDEKNYIDDWKLNFRSIISKNIRGYLNNIKKIDAGFYYKALKDFEKPLLIETLRYTNYIQLLSAELLGINRNTLRKKMFDYNIQVTKKTSS